MDSVSTSSYATTSGTVLQASSTSGGAGKRLHWVAVDFLPSFMFDVWLCLVTVARVVCQPTPGTWSSSQRSVCWIDIKNKQTTLMTKCRLVFAWIKCEDTKQMHKTLMLTMLWGPWPSSLSAAGVWHSGGGPKSPASMLSHSWKKKRIVLIQEAKRIDRIEF